MNVLPPRTYVANAREVQKVLPFGVEHPAKMHPHLARDLFLRYTLPGQVVLDPFLGRGTSLIGCTLGCHVIGNELEPPFVEYARQNYAHLKEHTLPGIALGDATILQGDSRRLPLPSASSDVVATSPPFGGSEVVDQRKTLNATNGIKGRGNRAGASSSQDNIARRHHAVDDSVVASPPLGSMNALSAGGAMDKGMIRPAADGRGLSGAPGELAIYSTHTPGQIGNVRHVACAISSPPYGDVASRNRSDEPYSQALDPELKAAYGAGDVNRHIDGYGETPGQIGNLPHAGLVDACVSSPPFAETLATSHAGMRDWARANGKPQGFGESTFADYGHSEGQIGAMSHDSRDSAVVTSPPYADAQLASHDDATTRGWQANGKPRGGALVMDRFGDAPEQISNQGGETYATACLAVYRECHRVVRPGGCLVLVVGSYVRQGRIVDLAADTIAIAQAAGWTPWERWEHRKATISFWRRLHGKQGRPVVAHEDVLVFVKGDAPGWEFKDLPPTTHAPVDLSVKATPNAETTPMSLGVRT